MKKIFALIIASAVLLTACSMDKNMESTTNTTVAADTTAENGTTEEGTNVAETKVQASGINLSNYSSEKVIWGPGRGENHQRPTDPVELQKSYEQLGAHFIMEDEKYICLTFDEGYENGYTPSILDTLKEKGVKAIFFVTYDFAKDNPDLIERMIDEGHIIGNHTYRHYTLDEVSSEVATEEISFLHDYMKENFKYRMTFFRFPEGSFSEQTLALADSLGYKSIFWSFAYEDWSAENPADPQEALKTVTDNFHNGEIMLLHAVSSTNASILGSIIDEAEKQGYTFTTEI